MTAWMMWEVVGPRDRAPPQLSRLRRWAEVLVIARKRGKKGVVNILRFGRGVCVACG